MIPLLAAGKWMAAFLAIVAVAVFSYRGLLPGSSYDLNVLMPGAAVWGLVRSAQLENPGRFTS